MTEGGEGVQPIFKVEHVHVSAQRHLAQAVCVEVELVLHLQ